MPSILNREQKRRGRNGHTLVELLVVLIILSIITAVAMSSMRAGTDVARTEKTKQLLQQVNYAIAGNPSLTSGGGRADYGYVGDIGAMPPNLDALVLNPGGYATWNGPYISDEFSSGGADVSFKYDAWGQALSLSGPSVIANGGGTTITSAVAPSLDDLLRNAVVVTVMDMAETPPGAVFKDSLRALLIVPNGTGGTTTKTKLFAGDGLTQFDSIPIGVHLLRVVYLPNSDTLRRQVPVNPGQTSYATVKLYRKVW
ncbi:MAG: type II secretion system protein [Candidatus Zixiibacteriota bacterium]